MQGIGNTGKYCKVETSSINTEEVEGIKYQVYEVEDFEKGNLIFQNEWEWNKTKKSDPNITIENIPACPESHSYYQWVPYVLVLQGVLFMMPHYRKITLPLM